MSRLSTVTLLFSGERRPFGTRKGEEKNDAATETTAGWKNSGGKILDRFEETDPFLT